jgi:hypothetical protein
MKMMTNFVLFLETLNEAFNMKLKIKNKTKKTIECFKKFRLKKAPKNKFVS